MTELESHDNEHSNNFEKNLKRMLKLVSQNLMRKRIFV